MFGKNIKKEENTISIEQLNEAAIFSAEKVSASYIETEIVLESTKSSTTEILRSDKGRFVIKSNATDKVIDIVREVDAKQLFSDYPALKGLMELKKMKFPFLYISEQAEREIKEHISWNEKTQVNVCEQGGILIGQPFRIGKSILGIVEHAIPAEVSCSNSVYLEMGTKTWIKMLNIYDEKYKEKGLFVIGWFHTHPNSLPVFMSGTDMGTQRRFFNQNWHFSVVLNPHKCLIACFNSANADKCDYYLSDFADE